MGGGAGVAATGARGLVTPERWERIKSVVSGALETPLDERSAYLDRVCDGDDALRSEADSLLAAADGSDSLPGARAAIARTRDAAEREGDLQRILETALAGQYQIVRPLGRGGMGAVFLARERSLDRFVAIKVLRPDLAGAHGAEGRERFRREARIIAQLSHPSILALHAFGEVAGLWYFVMGYVRGMTLAERLRRDGRLPSADVQRILVELADALECAHRHGVVHRDIKPANILLDDETGRAVLADFGIARVEGALDSITATGAVVGSPHYMSPEQVLGNASVDERSDLYSLGAVGYTMLAGREPFVVPAATAHELMYRRLSHDPPPLASVAPDVPADLARVVTRCLAREPRLRWPNAKTLKEALARAGGDAALPSTARDLPTFGPYAVLWALAWAAVASRTVDSPGEAALLALIGLLVPVGFLLHLWSVGRHGLSAMELARVAFWPPEWWGMWWPRALRRPGDVWATLPWPARAVRIALSTFFVALPSIVLLRPHVVSWIDFGSADRERAWIGAIERGMVGTIGAIVAATLVWSLRRGLTLRESARLLIGATTPSEGWSVPSVARLLTAKVRGVRQPERDSATDHLRAIAELAAQLPSDMTEVGGEALALARRLGEAIAQCELEVAAVDRAASAADVASLTAQRDRFDDGLATANPEQRELIALVQRQLDLLHRMRARADVLVERRSHLSGLLRRLWTYLCSASDATPGTSDASAWTSLRADIDDALGQPTS